jgi:hypothetical protein
MAAKNENTYPGGKTETILGKNVVSRAAKIQCRETTQRLTVGAITIRRPKSLHPGRCMGSDESEDAGRND